MASVNDKKGEKCQIIQKEMRERSFLRERERERASEVLYRFVSRTNGNDACERLR